GPPPPAPVAAGRALPAPSLASAPAGPRGARLLLVGSCGRVAGAPGSASSAGAVGRRPIGWVVHRRIAPRRATTGSAGLSCGLVLRLEREQFLELLRRDPSVSLSIAAELSRRLRSAHQVRLRGEQVVAASLGEAPDDGRDGVGFGLDGVTTDDRSPRMEGARS